MEAGQFSSGCPAIAESQRIDPHPGTLFTLAECHAKWGKVASAVAEYQQYADLVSRLPRDQQRRHQARADIARAQVGKLKPTVPTLALLLPAGAPQGTFVTRNGEVLKGVALGLPLPVDPGQYSIVTHAPGAPERETNVTIELGDKKQVSLEVTVPQNQPAAAATPAPVPALPAAPLAPEPKAQPEAASSQSSGGARNTIAYVIGGVGVGGVAVGSVTGILVFGKKGTVSDNCTGSSCNDTGLAAVSKGQTLATVSNIGFAVGVAGIAVSAILLLTGGSESTVAASGHATHWQPALTAGREGFTTGLSRRW